MGHSENNGNVSANGGGDEQAEKNANGTSKEHDETEQLSPKLENGHNTKDPEEKVEQNGGADKMEQETSGDHKEKEDESASSKEDKKSRKDKDRSRSRDRHKKRSRSAYIFLCVNLLFTMLNTFSV